MSGLSVNMQLDVLAVTSRAVSEARTRAGNPAASAALTPWYRGSRQGPAGLAARHWILDPQVYRGCRVWKLPIRG